MLYFIVGGLQGNIFYCLWWTLCCIARSVGL